MIGQKASRVSFGLAVVIALSSVSVALAACSGTGPVTCTGGAGAAVHVLGGNDGTTTAASTYPASLTVSGAPGGATVATVTLTLNGYTATTVNGASSRSMGLLLKSPGGRNLEIMRSVGRASIDSTNLTIAIQDGATSMTSACVNGGNAGLVTSGTFAPSAFGCSESGNAEPDYTVSGGPARAHSAATNGTSTLTNVFAGDTANGTWSLYLVDDAGNADVSFNSWSITLTVSAATSPSTTTLTPNPTTAFTTSPNNTVALTASVTAGATGTVTFKDGATNLTCAGGNPATISGSTAVCSTAFSTEGLHPLTAIYSGDATFVTSQGTANVYIQNHSTNGGTTTYCNAGPITNNGRSDLAFSNTGPYPSVIFVGDGVNTDIANSVNTVSVQLKNFSAAGTNALHMLLVAPDGTHAYDFWSNVGSTASAGNYTIVDGSIQLPNSAISPGTYGPTADGTPPDPFTPAPAAPAPQIPGSFSSAPPQGSKTFQTAFVGAAAHGAWSLFLYNASGATATTSAAGGWCLNISPGTGFPTTTTETSSAAPFATQGSSVTFTATVSSAGHPTPNQGVVTFTENGSPLTGAPNSGVANVSGGVATIATTGLPEGDHTVSASYHDPAGTYNDSFGTVTMRVDKATSTPTLNGSTWSFCNAGAVTIPTGTLFLNDTGQGSPNPSNIFVTKLPGTISTASVTLKGFSVFRPSDLESLLVGPGATTAQSLDFFSKAGGTNVYGPTDTSFADGSATVGANSPPAAVNGPTSLGTTTYFSSPFYTLPGTIQHATTQGAFTFNTGTLTGTSGGVYLNKNGNGTWSLYFNQLTHSTGSGVNNGWCVNIVPNPVTVSATKSHTGSAPSNHFKQGEQGAQYHFAITNNGDFAGNGSTGDPDGAHPLTVIDVLNASFTVGSPLQNDADWTCTSVSQTVTCKSHDTIASGSSYPTLTIPVNVNNNAAATANNQGSLSGGGITATNSNIDTVTIDPAPVLAIAKSHSSTFTQGSTATWNIQVTNNAVSASGSTDGTTVTVTDTLPTGYTLNTFSGTGWSCSGTNAVTCTTTAVVVGAGGTFNLLTLTVNVPANSPTSVSNTAKVFGGGDVIHTNSGNAASGSDNNVPVVQVPASVTINGSASQSAPINTAFGSLAVTVKDAGGVVIPSFASVVFTAPASGASGTFSTTTNTKTVATNASGVADPGTFTANLTVGGPYTLSVVAGPASVNFSLTNTPGPPTSMTANPGTTPQSATINTAFTNALAVTIKDAGNNPVSGVNVTFTAPGSGASGKFSNNTATITVATNASGVAAAPITANTVAGGPYTVAAASAGLTTVNFSLTNTAGPASSMTANAGTSPQSATISTAFTNALAVTVKDASNNPVPGVTVTFTAPGTGASGLFSNSTTTITVATNASGVASAPFTANATAGGPYTVTAAASGLTTVNFSLTNTTGAASTMTANPGTTPQSAAINTAFTNALAVTVKDAGSNPVSGINVTFTAPGSGASGKFSNNTVTITVATNASGVASAPFTANGTSGGPYTVTAAASGLTTVNFSLTNTAGTATTMTANAGTSPQSATINTAFTNALAVTVKDAGSNPVSGVNVTFTAPGSGASGLFSNSTMTITVATNASGVASAPFTANGTSGGPYTVSATASGLTTVNFSLTNTTGAASSMTANPGTTPQSTTINTAFTNALAVTVKDAGSNPVSGVNVTFTAPGSGASGLFSNSTTTITVATNASGVASAPFTANGTVGGPYTVTAAAAGLTTVNFSLTNTAGGATSMTANAGTTPQSATVLTAFTNALAVTVKDAGNNPVSGVNVTFTAPGSGASGLFSNSTTAITVATNASGIASGPFTANANVGGPYTVTAAAAGLTTVNFSLTNTAAAAASMTANPGTTPQSAAINTAFTNALAVTVKDGGNNPVSGVNVTFTAPGSGASGLFSNSTTTITVATNASGVASAPFTANGTAGGPYTVTAASAGLTTVNFSLTNTSIALPPTVTNVSSTVANGTYGTGATIPITVTFSNAVNVIGTPQLALNSGGTANYSSGSGTSTLTFIYLVGAGQNSAHLDYTSVSALTLNGGSIQDGGANNAILTLPAPGAAGSLGANKNIVINTVAPTVVSFSVLFGTQSYNVVGSLRTRLPWQVTGITVVFSAPITSGDLNSLTGVTPTGFSGLGTNTLTWSIAPIPLGNVSALLAGSGADALKDASNNPLGGGAGFTQNFKVLWSDINDDGVVNASDLVLVNAARSQPYNIFADVDGNGTVDTTDVSIARSRVGTSLP